MISPGLSRSSNLRYEHDLLLKIFETVPIAIVIVNRDGIITQANSQAEKTLTLSRSDLEKRIYDAPEWSITDYDGNPFPDEELPFSRVKATCTPITDIGHAIVLPTGERRLLTINAAPLFDASGTFDGMVASIEDVTEKIRKEQAFIQSEAMLKSVFRAAPVGIGVVKDRIITWTNRRMHEMTGYTEEELSGKSARILYPTQDEFEYVGREKYRGIRESGTGTVQTRWKRADGRIIEVLLSSTPIDLNDHGKGVTFSALDITDRIQIEEQLRHSEKMDAIGQLAGGIAHDFNNQLAGIMGYADLLSVEAGKGTDEENFAHRIKVSVKRAADLTAQLLAFARKGKYLSVPVDVHKIIFEVTSLLKHSVRKTIRIKQLLNAHPETTKGDPSQLQSALLNVALNACDAMPDGGVLTLTTETVEIQSSDEKDLLFDIAEGTYVKIDIADTGTGIPPEVIEHIFEPFFTTKESGKGTGLGLAAVYGTVKHHGGGIAVHSEPDNGTAISIFLPVLAQADYADDVPRESSEPARFDRHVLVVDDEEQVREMVASMLKSLGCRVTVCSNGKEAMEFYHRNRATVDAVILDLIMPEMDGVTTFRELRKLAPKLKVIIASGYSIEGDARQLLEEGASDFIQKPFLRLDLAEKLTGVFG